MRIAKEKVNSLKSANATKGFSRIPVTAKNAAQMRGRTGMKNASGNSPAGSKSSSSRGGKK